MQFFYYIGPKDLRAVILDSNSKFDMYVTEKKNLVNKEMNIVN